ncbi:MAG TPA: CPBP family intramembrane glutamic endopeptidase [Planctomycetota bacterium]|nr:CPBP family intramembrane glutamic endopeptidase [Planctomycetota bacterium]
MTTTEAPAPSRPSLLIPLALVAFSADVLIYYFTILPLREWSSERFEIPSWGILAHYGLRAAFAALAAAAMVRWRALAVQDLGLRVTPFREDAAWTLRLIATLTVVSVVLIGVAVAVIRIFDLYPSPWPLETRDPGGWGYYLLCSVVAAPLVEEFVYRSLLTPALRSGYGDRGAIVAGALLFYVLHLVYGASFWKVHYLVAGAILTWAYVKRGRLWICVLLHAGGNLLVVLDDAVLQWAPNLFRAILGKLPTG